MPADAPMAKVEAARGQGAIVHVGGNSVDACLVAALERAETGGLAFVHPFDDPAIVAGQGSLGLELLEDVPDLGEGRRSRSAAAGCAPASRWRSRPRRPDVRIVGVQAAACAPFPESMQRGRADRGDERADDRRRHRGQAPRRHHAADARRAHRRDRASSARTRPPRRWRCCSSAASSSSRAREPSASPRCSAGRSSPPSAASRSRSSPAATSTPACWPRSPAATRPSPAAGSSLLTRVPDRPGGARPLLATVAGTGANIVDVSHVREGLDLHVRETAVELCSRRAATSTPSGC